MLSLRLKNLTIVILFTTILLNWIPSLTNAAIKEKEPEPNAKWDSSIQKVFEKKEQWQMLLKSLVENQKYYGALATVLRMQSLFTDLETKELALRAIVHLIDQGYLYPIKTIFSQADLEPSDDPDFVNSYYLYKAVTNQERGMIRWADYYFSLTDQKNFAKYKFYLALSQYKKGNLEDSLAELKNLLKSTDPSLTRILREKSARTLARIYFERQEYSKSLEIYTSYLLNLNPVVPDDYLEAAWNLYHLKLYQQALGMLLNLRVPLDEYNEFESLEPITLKALIYKELCWKNEISSLHKTIKVRFGRTISSIKAGATLKSIKQLRTITVPNDTRFKELIDTIHQLIRESKYVSDLPNHLNTIAIHLYRSEISHLKNVLNSYIDQGLNNAASELIALDESMSFLISDVEQESVDLSALLKEKTPTSRKIAEEQTTNEFLIHWPQQNDLWRDERLLYRAVTDSKCPK